MIVSEEHCVHKGVSEYVLEMEQSMECGDMCDFHHLFHFSAIITPAVQYIVTEKHAVQPDIELLEYHPSYKQTETKPPIA